MSDDEKRISDPSDQIHVYDGIVEENHPLPGWWQWTLYGAIVFAVIYWFDVQAMHIHPSPREAYDAEQAAAADRAWGGGGPGGAPAITDDLLQGFSRNPTNVAEGKAIFTSTCASCHRADGGGGIGPNLTDAYWLHGSKPKNVFDTIRDGVPAKGMPTWGPQLGERKIASVAAYVMTIEHSNAPGGKAPQGEPEK